MNKVTDNVVANWFGEKFHDLHPLLQTLHLNGGTLSGRVDLRYGKGLASYLAPRLARRLGLPPHPGVMDFNVIIEHTPNTLAWTRLFDNRHTMRSEFIPVGRYPNGFWRETTGEVALDLGVEIRNGGWYWATRGMTIKNINVPRILVPRSRAGKYIDGDTYCFDVKIGLPGLGRIISYRGKLHCA